jgi:hypothetical protein
MAYDSDNPMKERQLSFAGCVAAMRLRLCFHHVAKEFWLWRSHQGSLNDIFAP